MRNLYILASLLYISHIHVTCRRGWKKWFLSNNCNPYTTHHTVKIPIQPTRHGPVSAGIWTLMKSQIGTCSSMRPKRGSHVRGTHPSVVWMVWKRLGNICIHKFIAWLNHMLILYIICTESWKVYCNNGYWWSSPTFSAPSGTNSIAKVCESLSLSPVFVGTSLQRDPSQSLDTNWMWRWVAHVWTWIPSVN